MEGPLVTIKPLLVENHKFKAMICFLTKLQANDL